MIKKFKTWEKIVLCFLLAWIAFGLARTVFPIALSPVIGECNTSQTTRVTVLVVGDSVCVGVIEPTNIGFLSVVNTQLNPFWNLCSEMNATVVTECRGGVGIRYFDSKLDGYLDEHDPDYLVLQSFHNDVFGSAWFLMYDVVPIACCEYRERLQSIVDKAVARNVSFVLVFGSLKVDASSGYADCIRAFVVENDIAFIDLREIKSSSWLLHDGVHPNQLGQDLIRERLLEELK